MRYARVLRGFRSAAKPAASAMRQHLDDPDPRVRETIGTALKRMDADAAQALVPPLTEAMRAQDPDVRLKAARSLHALRPESDAAVAALVGALADPSAAIRLAAARALGAIKPESKRAVAGLTAALSDDSEAVRRAAAMALEGIRRKP